MLFYHYSLSNLVIFDTFTHDNKYIEILSLIFYCFIYRKTLEYKIIFVIFHILQRYTKSFDEMSNVADGPPFFVLDPS